MAERRSERASLAAILARVRQIKQVIGSDRVYLPGGAHHAMDDAIDHIEEEAKALLAQVRQGIHENPGTLAVYGNPRSERVNIGEVEVRYQMGKPVQVKYKRSLSPIGDYFHDFGPKDSLYAVVLVASGQRCLLIANDDDKPLWGRG